jgi:N-acylneuraminate cytidylyltransferase/CMP-N,N'-diacetyllegionaminic acid synthase
MFNKKKILCVIPARSGSKGIKNKNTKKLGGQPLIAWPIKAALKSRYLDMVLVSTDSLKISKLAKKYGAEVPFLRPKELATDTAATVNVIKHAIKFLNKKLYIFDYVLCLEPTSPLTSGNDIDNAIDQAFNNIGKKYESWDNEAQVSLVKKTGGSQVFYCEVTFVKNLIPTQK